MFTTLAIAGTFILTQICKQWVKPRYGATGVHVFAFLAAFIIISIKGIATSYPPLGIMLIEAGKYFLASMALYQVIIKPLSASLNIPDSFSSLFSS